MDIAEFETFGVTNNVEQECREIMEQVKSERRKHIKYKIMCDVLNECTRKCDDLDDDVKFKLKGILLNANSDDPLMYQEICQIKLAFEKRLTEKHKLLMEELEELLGKNTLNKILTSKESDSLDWWMNDKIVVDLKSQLSRSQKSYVENLLIQSELLEQMVQLKTVKVPQLAESKVKESLHGWKKSNLRLKIIEQNLQINLLTEDACSLSAYTQLINDVSQQQSECKHEIKELEVTKEKYKQMMSAEFKEILRDYSLYKSGVERKRLLYDQLSK